MVTLDCRVGFASSQCRCRPVAATTRLGSGLTSRLAEGLVKKATLLLACKPAVLARRQQSSGGAFAEVKDAFEVRLDLYMDGVVKRLKRCAAFTLAAQPHLARIAVARWHLHQRTPRRLASQSSGVCA
ncbi:hypothetical protein [Candidatus Accumulibacter sp. ACC003]|uniref:hypothetical protein n=1 Tax=Candidatus Accumulibacter sp. ACC003 TaxID=2823334 RepID=UPI0025B963C1|nr:hypothetical protein [Candidatus Accumulibacter sp. ACC003]